MEKDEGPDNSTSNELQIYAAIILLLNDTNSPVTIHDIKSHDLERGTPMSTIHLSLNRLIRAKKICHVGSDRSGLWATTPVGLLMSRGTVVG